MTDHVYVGLVRGINVGTAHAVSMTDFRAVFETLGFTSVGTLLRSGNVVFVSGRRLTAADTAAIEAEFERVAGFAAGFVILAAEQFETITAENPLLEVGTDPSKLVVAYVPPTPDARAALASKDLVLPDPDALLPEILTVGPNAVYNWCPNGISKSKVPASFWRQLGITYTARNVNTVEKLRAMVHERSNVGGGS
ncbi:DUF1697 domain-containing protein [Subtercola sp. YIM 133946]|uniref:DUF1697 domain-containing protein n=1 Tax=Subtercola sp. YIM 133946 TaxID=3118909 RepID=UPI002F91CA01